MERLRLAIGWTVLAAWVFSMILDAVVPEYAVPATVHGLMLLVVGAFFGPNIVGRKRNGD